ILGIIVGVLFYDMLMRMWGVQEVSVIDVKTYTSQANKAAKKVPPPQTAKEQVKAPSVHDAAKEKIREDKNIPPQIQPPQEPAKEKPVDIVSDQLQSKAEKVAANKQPLVQKGQSFQTAATGTVVKYKVIGVGANVRSGPGMGNDVVTVVNEGDVFSGLGEKNGRWVKIQAPDGKEGWISAKVIQVVE
ncbi:MAG: SH3 domain-containing protein, partial [Thermodesulfobacteriota bacterium]